MEIKKIPLLAAGDVECRIQQVKEKPGHSGEVQATLLLYKNARCDMKYLDELFGVYGWKRSHRVIGDRLYCTVSIYDSDKKEWVDKEDVGTESNTEKEKGQASDAFKRACFNIGIGRELYTAPSIKVSLKKNEYIKKNNSYKSYAAFCVKEIGYDEKRNITNLVITDRFGNERFVFKNGKEISPRKHAETEEIPAPKTLAKQAKDVLYADVNEQKEIKTLIIKMFGGWNEPAQAACIPILKKYDATGFKNIPKESVAHILKEIEALNVT